jgi:hypothetical protein
MNHCVLKLYQDCSNYSPRVKIGPPRGHWFSLYVYSKNCSHPHTLTLIITLKFLVCCLKTSTSYLHKKIYLFCIFLRPGNFTFVYQLHLVLRWAHWVQWPPPCLAIIGYYFVIFVFILVRNKNYLRSNKWILLQLIYGISLNFIYSINCT